MRRGKTASGSCKGNMETILFHPFYDEFVTDDGLAFSFVWFWSSLDVSVGRRFSLLWVVVL